VAASAGIQHSDIKHKTEINIKYKDTTALLPPDSFYSIIIALNAISYQILYQHDMPPTCTPSGLSINSRFLCITDALTTRAHSDRGKIGRRQNHSLLF
jgi:hypothetical protein